MTFADFFTKIREKFRIKEQKIEEKIEFDGIGGWIEKERKEIENKEKEIFSLIKNKSLIVVKELNEKVRILEDVDIESKRVEDKIKLIVRENLNNYIGYVKDFIIDIDNFKKEELDKIIYRVNKIFLEFDKKSYKSYQKATFLIGKEMADIKESIINFSKDLTRIFDENKEIINSSKIISFIKLKLKQIDEISEVNTKVNERIMSLDLQIKNAKEMNEKILKEIQKIKESKNYVENLKKQKEIKLSEKELENEVYKLKGMIDFKALGNIFHVNEEKMDIVKTHKEGFQTIIQKDNGKSLLILLDEAKLNNETILNKIKQINEKEIEIIRNKSTIKKDETKDLLDKIEKIKSEIENLNNEKAKESKRFKKLKISREKIISSIKQELTKVNVIILNI